MDAPPVRDGWSNALCADPVSGAASDFGGSPLGCSAMCCLDQVVV